MFFVSFNSFWLTTFWLQNCGNQSFLISDLSVNKLNLPVKRQMLVLNFELIFHWYTNFLMGIAQCCGFADIALVGNDWTVKVCDKGMRRFCFCFNSTGTIISFWQYYILWFWLFLVITTKQNLTYFTVLWAIIRGFCFCFFFFTCFKDLQFVSFQISDIQLQSTIALLLSGKYVTVKHFKKMGSM